MTERYAPVKNALLANAAHFSNANADSQRIFHGRGHCFPGLAWLTVDYFSPLILLTVYRGFEGDEAQLQGLTSIVVDFFSENTTTVNSIVLQRRDLAGAPIKACWGELPEEAKARRGDLEFTLNFKQQNPGFFLDIEPARYWLEQHCHNKRVLNLFAYTCAFSVVAAAAGARSVVNIDMSARSLRRGRENHAINNIACNGISFFAHDIFKSWGKLKKYGPYDIIIIDPPSFQKGSFIAAKDYCKTLRKIPDLLAPGGVFLACLNAPEISIDTLKGWVSDTLPSATLQQALPVADGFTEREGEGALKMLVYGV